MKTATFKIRGMRCAGCAQIVQTMLERNDGVRTCSVSFTDGTARVLFDPARIDEDRLASSIEQAGYRITDRSQ
ncbi:MAG: heavy-metal-associated domain-containing protein [Gammaproteobacteria bacterium]|nr:heavy-metal-associated domain-containing protein [Gammaproteobacteria bacterium]